MQNIEQKNITSLDELREYAKGSVIELPPFGAGQNLVVRVKRPSIMQLAANNVIPNELLDTANKLFITNDEEEKKKREDDKEFLGRAHRIMAIFAETMLLEPTYNDFVEAGLELTDAQLMTLYNYAQVGVQALIPFRGE